MNESVTLTSLETFEVTVKGDDVPECRARAWDKLQCVLGCNGARDPVDRWVATKLRHLPNPLRFRVQEDGSVVEDEEEPRLLCDCEFTRETSGRATFA